jgi:hypothetical protein
MMSQITKKTQHFIADVITLIRQAISLDFELDVKSHSLSVQLHMRARNDNHPSDRLFHFCLALQEFSLMEGKRFIRMYRHECNNKILASAGQGTKFCT